MKLMGKVLDTSYQAAMPDDLVTAEDIAAMEYCGPDAPNYPDCLNVKHPWEVANDPADVVPEWERKQL